MKRMLLLIAAVTLLAACANTNENKTANSQAPQAVMDQAESEPDWTKPQYCIGVQGDTIAQWIYDEAGQLSQLYILGALFQDEYAGEHSVNSSYVKFDPKGRLQAIVSGDEEATYRYEFKYGYEEDEEEDDASYTEEDVEMEYDDLDRVIYVSFRVNWSYFADSRTYEGRVCYVDAYCSVPQMDELGMPYLEDPKETKYEYTIYY